MSAIAPDLGIRFSPVGCVQCQRAFNQQADRLNKMLRLIEEKLAEIIAAQQAASATPSPVAAPGYPGIENGSSAMIQGPVPGGPSPIPSFIPPHTVIIGEGSKPVVLLTLTNGELVIGSTGADPVAATITPEFGIAITNGPGSIQLGFDTSVQTWITGIQAWAQGMQEWADEVSIDLGISAPSPPPPADGPT